MTDRDNLIREAREDAAQLRADGCNLLASTIDRLIAALVSPDGGSPTDTERLDWLIAEGHVLALQLYQDGVWAFGWLDDDTGHEGATARQAIDIAMSSHSGAGE